ncbi:MAG: DUF1501 domain-containing protein, partial [Planctomycetes bacterium]|nr:DUF1501 domain-containing protein [Planctomycetota bacterium]
MNRITAALPRRAFLNQSGWSLGAIAASTLIAREAVAKSPAETPATDSTARALAVGTPHFAPRAKRVISLFMHGGPSQLDLFDHKPDLVRRHGEELPAAVRGTQRLTGM